MRSPVDGVVNDVQVTTIGGYVQPGQKIMEVVPMGDKLLVETRVKPSDIAFIKVGDRALVKVTAYDFSTYGGLEGRVVQVSADSIYDENEKQAYFTVIVETDRSYLRASGHRLPITPGMMTDTQIITGRKSDPDLSAQAGVEGEQRGAARALIGGVGRRGELGGLRWHWQYSSEPIARDSRGSSCRSTRRSAPAGNR